MGTQAFEARDMVGRDDELTAVLTFVTLPLALVGGVIGNDIAGGVISIGSMVGFFTVLGIVARNGIMMITHFQHLEHEEGMEFGPELVLRGARERLAPIVMTGPATSLAGETWTSSPWASTAPTAARRASTLPVGRSTSTDPT